MPESTRLAIIANDPPEAARLTAWCAERGLAAARSFRADQFDDVERAIREGRVTCVVVSRAATLIQAMLEGEADFLQWQAANVRIEVHTESDAAAVAALPEFQRVLRGVEAGRRRRNALFGAGLSLITIGLCAAYWVLTRE